MKVVPTTPITIVVMLFARSIRATRPPFLAAYGSPTPGMAQVGSAL